MRVLAVWTVAVAAVLAIVSASFGAGAVPFEKRVLTDKYYCDGINTADFNRDRRPDIVAGPYWYEGPEFRTKHEFYPAVPLEPAKSPSNSMFSYVHDFNADGWPDILVLGRVHLHSASWYENPRGGSGHWKKHYVFERIQGETPPFADLGRTGRRGLVCHWENRWGYVAPHEKRPAEPWIFHPITAKADYGQCQPHLVDDWSGVGLQVVAADVTGDGATDILTASKLGSILFVNRRGGADSAVRAPQ